MTAALRLDLLELSPEALTALANPGFVKRALKDLAEGRGPSIEVKDDGTIVAVYDDGHQAELGPTGTLRDAVCSCPASGLCRHRVTLIAAYQQWARSRPETPVESETVETARIDDDWSPADFSEDQIQAAFKKGVLKQADLLIKGRPSIRLARRGPDHGVPTAYLPMSTVRFFSARNLAHARCDCLDGSGCVHVLLAIRAFQQARARDFQEVTVALGAEAGPAGPRLFNAQGRQAGQAVQQLIAQIWDEGLAQPPAALAERLAVAAALAEGLKWRWVSESVDELRRLIEAYQARSSRFSGDDLMDALAFLYARLEAAEEAERLALAEDEAAPPRVPAERILGLGLAGETALEHLNLIGLGTELWTDEGHCGLRSYFVDPDTMTTMVLERGFESGGVGLLNRRLAGLPLKRLARAQLVTRGARRRANGLVNISADARLTNALAMSGRAWENLSRPLKWAGADELADYLRSRPPEFIEARQALSCLAILPVGEVLSHGWEPGTQKLTARLDDGREPAPGLFGLELPYRRIEEAALLSLAAQLASGRLTEVCGLARLEGGRVVLRPLALVADGELVALAVAEAAEIDLPDPPPEAGELSAVGHRLEDLRQALRQDLLDGLRHRRPRSDWPEMIRDLRRLGLPLCADLAESLAAALTQNDQAARLSLLTRLTLMIGRLQRDEIIIV